jgi:hypothetical protein
MRPARLAVLLLCACETSSTRLQQAEVVQAREIADEDVTRAEAALAALRPRPIALPAAPAPGAYVDVALTLRAAQPTEDDALTTRMKLRLTSLGFAVVPLEVDAGRVKLTVPSVRATDVDTLITAVTLGGHVRGATVPRGLESITAGDPRWTWRDLPIDDIVAETPDGALTPDITMVFTPDGAATLLELTTPKQALAIVVDDRALTNAAVSEPLTAGQVRLSPDGELDAAVLTAALKYPLPTPLRVEAQQRAPVAAYDCADAAGCELLCRDGSVPACLGLLASAAPTALEFADLACQQGVGLGCARLCEHGADITACRAAVSRLIAPGWLDTDPVGAQALLMRGCERGDLDACTSALGSLVLPRVGVSDFVTADHMLMQLRDAAVLAQTSALRKHSLNTARELCEDDTFSPDSAAQACLFTVKAHRDGVLASPDPALERTLLRRAGRLLARGAP